LSYPNDPRRRFAVSARTSCPLSTANLLSNLAS
jgi:hypothetical protein